MASSNPVINGHCMCKNMSGYHHHHISVMELGHLLTRLGLMYPEASSKVCRDSFCQLGNSIPGIINYSIMECLPTV
jgi:hypothetical protein